MGNLNSLELMGFIFMFSMISMIIIVIIISTTKEVCKFFERRRPHVGEVWEKRKSSNPWAPRCRAEIVEIKGGWLRYRETNFHLWNRDCVIRAERIYKFLWTYRKTKDKGTTYRIGCDFRSQDDFTAIYTIDRPIIPKASFVAYDETSKFSKKMFKKILHGKYNGYSVGSKKAGKK